MRESRQEREARYDRIAKHYRRHPPTTDERLAELESAFHGLLADLKDAHDDIDSLARRDWPSVPSAPLLITQEMTVGGQLQVLEVLATFLLTRCGCTAAQPLVDRVRALLAPGFVAPTRTLTPPRAVALAIKRIRPSTPAGAALATPQLHDSPSTSRDRRLVLWWASQLEN